MLVDANSDYSGSVGWSDECWFFIGGNSDYTASNCNGGYGGHIGNLDDIAFWDRALDENEVSSLFEGISGDEEGLAAYWDNNNVSDNVLVDHSGNGNDGTIIDGTLSDEIPIPGCSDPAASNYNSEINVAIDNLCEYPGCTDESACNYDPVALENDGSCEYPEEFFDCEGNCIAELDCAGTCGGILVEDCSGLCGGENICGCPDSVASNYNPAATVSDGNCEYDIYDDYYALNLSSSYIETAHSTDFNFGNDDFTISFWVRFDGLPQDFNFLIGTMYNTGGSWAADAGWMLTYRWNGRLRLNTATHSSYDDKGRTWYANWSPVYGDWYKITVMQSGTNNILMFVDDTQLSVIHSDAIGNKPSENLLLPSCQNPLPTQFEALPLWFQGKWWTREQRAHP